MDISKKPKKCKGIGKAQGVMGCGGLFLKRTFGLCNNCLHDFLFETDAGKMVFHSRIIPKAKAKIKKENTENTRKLREKVVNYKDELQKKINLIVRLIDKDLPCLAKGIYPNQMHAGHIFSRGSSPEIRFNLHNIHRQSAQSNHFQNEDGLLREQLQKEYGKEYYRFLCELRCLKQLKYKNDDYLNFYKKASKIALKLKKENKTYSILERIELRNQINLELNIYEPEYCVFNEVKSGM